MKSYRFEKIFSFIIGKIIIYKIIYFLFVFKYLYCYIIIKSDDKDMF